MSSAGEVVEEHECECEEGEGAWIISYADMMTLLMSFFAIMFSFSKVDQNKFDDVRKSITKEFGSTLVMPFESLSEELKNLIIKKQLEKKVQVFQNSNSLSIVFQGSTLFQEGSSELNSEAKDTISEFLDLLAQKAGTLPVVVEGHTDDNPISSTRYPSNWELSSARANLILRMLEEKGLAHHNLQSQGFSDTRPLLPNRSKDGTPIEANQTMNRRITIKVFKELPE